jgi:hypothetical protein
MSVGIGNIKNKKAITHLFYEMPIKKVFYEIIRDVIHTQYAL